MKKFTLAMIAASALSATGAFAQEVVVGGKGFTEQLLLAEITSQLLSANGFDVEKNDGLGTTVLRSAQENGQVDLYWEYTGTSLITFNGVEEDLSPEETVERVRTLDAEVGLSWLACSDANNTYALAVREEDEATDEIFSLSDLAASFNNGNPLDLAVNAEFPRRPDGLPGVEETYGFKVKRANIRSMDGGLTYQALNEDEVDVALVFATDGRIAAFGFRVLEDDKGFFPAYSICPVVRTEFLQANPQVQPLLESVSAILNDAIMQGLNSQIDVERNAIEDVATTFLTENGLL